MIAVEGLRYAYGDGGFERLTQRYRKHVAALEPSWRQSVRSLHVDDVRWTAADVALLDDAGLVTGRDRSAIDGWMSAATSRRSRPSSVFARPRATRLRRAARLTPGSKAMESSSPVPTTT